MTRIALALVAFGWLSAAVGVVRLRHGDATRRGPLRWHRAVSTLRAWAPADAGPPVAATWCRPIVGGFEPHPPDLPRQRTGSPTCADALAGSSTPVG